MAFRHAVTVSHAPGLGGTPSLGHVLAAVVNASDTASSAACRSPSRRASVATMAVHSSRYAALQRDRRLLQGCPPRLAFQNRPHLHRAVPDDRHLARPLQRSVQIRHVQQIEPSRCSFVSMNGPSVSSRSPPCMVTVVAVSTWASCSAASNAPDSFMAAV
jgi:hypothetical protein